VTGLFLPEAKAWVIGATALTKDALHIHVGLVVFLAAMLGLRRRPGDIAPLAIVVAVALLGEAWDVRDRWVAGMAADVPGHVHDIVNTLFWPTLLTMAARLRLPFTRRR
jgi:hypothetical protein